MKVRSARFQTSAFTTSGFPKGGLPEIGLVGRSNVGKSCLINQLMQQPDLARTSRTPGRTQSLNFYLINESFYLVDFPGYGYARVPEPVRQSWRKLTSSYFQARTTLCQVLMIVDIRREATPLDLQLSAWLKTLGVSHTVVATKSDKFSGNQRRAALAGLRRAYGDLTVLAFSARTGDGREEVLEEIRNALLKPTISIA
ncbi:MAG: YihA family ribosome biogenesis GTP-binding protein [Acidobacteria bacterium]|nr:YihA family ribosome biogenesis GTP-binding protein [Acidobacteriota bacterium]